MRRTRQHRLLASWAEKDRSVVWSSAELAENLARILERRVMDAGRKGCRALPIASAQPASLQGVALFLSGSTDDARIAELLWGLCTVDASERLSLSSERQLPACSPLPGAYALLKLLHLPEPIRTRRGEVQVRPEPSVLSLLRGNRVGDACAIAVRRLRASGLVPMGCYAANGTCGDWATPEIDGPRLAAALLIPVSRADAHRLADLVVRPDTSEREAVA
jgi:CRISPR-associated protein Csx17